MPAFLSANVDEDLDVAILCLMDLPLIDKFVGHPQLVTNLQFEACQILCDAVCSQSDDSSASATEQPAGSAPQDGVAADGFDGDWVPTAASEFGYRVDEVIAGVNVTAVGRSYEIPNPSSGPVTTEDNGLVEFVLVFEPA